MGNYNLAAVSKRYFGSWERQIAAAGVDYEAIEGSSGELRSD